MLTPDCGACRVEKPLALGVSPHSQCSSVCHQIGHCKMKAGWRNQNIGEDSILGLPGYLKCRVTVEKLSAKRKSSVTGRRRQRKQEIFKNLQLKVMTRIHLMRKNITLKSPNVTLSWCKNLIILTQQGVCKWSCYNATTALYRIFTPLYSFTRVRLQTEKWHFLRTTTQNISRTLHKLN